MRAFARSAACSAVSVRSRFTAARTSSAPPDTRSPFCPSRTGDVAPATAESTITGTTPTLVHGSGTTTNAVSSIQVQFSEQLNNIDASALAAYELRKFAESLDQGKDGWAIKVEYQADTIFGLQPVEAQALVVNGRVQGWFYTGSGEEVP